MINKLILGALIFLLAFNAASLRAQCLDSTIAPSNVYLPFTNGVSDSSSLFPNYSGVFNGAVTNDGIIGNCLTFDGLNDYASFNGNYDLDNDYTIATWIYPESSHYGSIFSQRAQCPTTDRGWGKLFLGIGGDMSVPAAFPYFTAGLPAGSITVSNQLFVSLPRASLNCNGWYNADIYTIPGVDVLVGCWSFVAITCTNNSSSSRLLKAFINGELYDMQLVNSPPISSGASSPFGNAGAPYETLLGINHYGIPQIYQYPFEGKMDEFYFYDFALDGCELQNISNEVIDINRVDLCNGDSLSYVASAAQNASLALWLHNGNTVGNSDTLKIGLNTISQGDTISFVFQFQNQCFIDTISTIVSFSTPNTVQYDTLTICASDSIQLFGNWENMAGNYSDTFLLNNGCDSIQFIELIVDDTLETSIQLTSCDSIIYQGMVFQDDTIITSFFSTTAGCDSIVSAHLIVIDTLYTNSIQLNSCDSVEIAGIRIWSDTNFSITYLSALAACDSMVSYQISISNSVSKLDTIVSCDPVTDIMGQLHNSSKSITYSFQTQNGCDSTLTFSIVILDTSALECIKNTCEISFPNVITPNGDGMNDLFTNVNNCPISFGAISIYNRWGVNVFQSTEYSFSWDGYSNGEKSSNGVYYYVFTFEGEVMKGSFILL